MDMNYIEVLIFMTFCHIIDDYYLQGILAQMKQKSWWKKQAEYSSLYIDDYKIALFMHSFSWSFMIMFPTLYIFGVDFNFTPLVIFIINIFVHAFVDNLKANKLKINLIVDQLIHITQIAYTALFIVLQI